MNHHFSVNIHILGIYYKKPFFKRSVRITRIEIKARNMLESIYHKIRAHFLDIGKPDDSIILAGMGRSGTSWAGDIINYDNSYRVVFEPFFPANVKESKGFEYIQYLNPRCNNAILTNQARIILAGTVRNNWVDKYNNRLFYRRRIIKDIRCNLMLGWLKRVANNPPIVLMIRHPLQIASSWSKLGWEKEALGNRNDFDIITSQESLLNDFPIISNVMKRIDKQDFVENIVFQWCIYQLIPSHHLKRNEVHALYYENLLTEPDNEAVRLFHYLNKPFDQHKLHKAIKKPSITNFLGRDFNKDQTYLLNSWKDYFSAKQIRRTNYILATFGLENIYDKDGYPTGAQVFSD